MFRSVDMSYLQVVLPEAVAEEFADRMAREDIMQFTDLNEDFQPFQRKYTSDIIKVQEIERQLKSIEELLDSYEIYRDTDVDGRDLASEKRPSDAKQIIQNIGKDIGNAYKKLREQANVEQELKNQLSQQEDSIRVLQQIDTFLQSEKEAQALLQQQRDEKKAAAAAQSANKSGAKGFAMPLLQVTGDPDGNLKYGDDDVGFKYFAGVVTVAQRVSFERQVFLTSRGNSFVQFEDNSEDMGLNNINAGGAGSGDDDRMPFVVFFLGDQLKRSLKRLCQFMNIQISYESDEKKTRDELLKESSDKRNDFYRIHSATSNQLEKSMKDISFNIKKWKIALLQEKAIRITLNKFSKNNNNFLRAEGWCPSIHQHIIKDILDDVTLNKGVGKPIVQDTDPQLAGVPPTHFILNEFTAPFQSIVNTYGVPRYKEFNPAVPTIITFPFLFAVMYGDVFHGSFIFLAAALLCIATPIANLKDTKNENLKSFVDARYVLLLMGSFAVYCGLIYNDVMSIMINGFNGSKWGYGFVDAEGEGESGQMNVLFQATGTYAFGIDPVWHALENQLAYENSLKMKLSVIIGVTQMTFGLFLKLSNHIQEGDYISIFFEFIPQFIFMMSFFGYMIFLIIYKWTIDWGTSAIPGTPSLITVLIKMILGATGPITSETQLFENASMQKWLQRALVILMFISVPWMLIIKPILLKRKHNREMILKHSIASVVDIESNKSYAMVDDNDNDNDMDDQKYNDNDMDPDNMSAKKKKKKKHGGGGGHGHGDEFVFSEIVIHQLIHTIEYVLGTISNTASYLRLWALSLAHAELSEVFYTQTIGGSSGMNQELSFVGVVTNVAAQFVFLMATVGVLLVMDVLECFLHALRLHWVEFQNKFFYADGISFSPFSYRLFLEVE